MPVLHSVPSDIIRELYKISIVMRDTVGLDAHGSSGTCSTTAMAPPSSVILAALPPPRHPKEAPLPGAALCALHLLCILPYRASMRIACSGGS